MTRSIRLTIDDKDDIMRTFNRYLVRLRQTVDNPCEWEKMVPLVLDRPQKVALDLLYNTHDEFTHSSRPQCHMIEAPRSLAGEKIPVPQEYVALIGGVRRDGSPHRLDFQRLEGQCPPELIPYFTRPERYHNARCGLREPLEFAGSEKDDLSYLQHVLVYMRDATIMEHVIDDLSYGLYMIVCRCATGPQLRDVLGNEFQDVMPSELAGVMEGRKTRGLTTALTKIEDKIRMVHQYMYLLVQAMMLDPLPNTPHLVASKPVVDEVLQWRYCEHRY